MLFTETITVRSETRNETHERTKQVADTETAKSGYELESPAASLCRGRRACLLPS
jgi:hypothetical protein